MFDPLLTYGRVGYATVGYATVGYATVGYATVGIILGYSAGIILGYFLRYRNLRFRR